MARTYGQHCGVSAALELVGERWALLIIRDLLVGPRRYTDLKQGLPRIPTNILSARLKELQEAGLVRRAHLAHCGLVYELTDTGHGLEDVVLTLGRWGFAAMDEPDPADVVTADSLTIALRAAFRPEVAATLPATRYRLRLDGVDLLIDVAADGLRVRPLGALRPVDGRTDAAGPPPDLELVAGPGLFQVFAGRVRPGGAPVDGVVVAAGGDVALLGRFTATFSPPVRDEDLLPTLA
ncbi:MAG: helix-turn-helix domain-containing protein [Propionicimonas sp.]|nr:helix-turn-helix domain-containing protein [Propionicimonas sp.]